MSFQVTNIANQQSLLAAVLDRALREIQLVWEIQDGSGTNGLNWHNELFRFSGAEELVEIILQEKNLSQQRAFIPIFSMGKEYVPLLDPVQLH